MIDISIVTTLYNSEIFIEEFIERIKLSVNRINKSYEIIFVDDGSIDNGCEVVKKVIEKDKRVRLVKFSKNYGHHKAMVCGLETSKGNHVFLIDVDLEEQPELIIEFYNKILETNDHLIYGIQINRNKDRFFGAVFWKLLGSMTGLSLENNPCTIRIMSRVFVDKMKLLPQKDFFLGELCSYVGMKQSTLEVSKLYKGNSSYNFIKKYSLLFNMLFTNTSNLWIKISFFATLLSFASFTIFLWLIISFLMGKVYLNGWLSLMVMITLFASINFFFFGLILQLVSKNLDEIKNKPRFIVEEVVN